MPGKTQRKYVGETMQIHNKLKRPLFFVAEALPCDYNENDLLMLFQEFYPFDWNMIVERCKQSHEKDDFLKSVDKKARYKAPSAETFFHEIPAVKTILSQKFKQQYKASFDESVRRTKYDELKKKRDAKNANIQQRIDKNTELMQNVEPYYVDVLIAAYHQHGITTEGKIEIVTELGKYICEKSLEFFYKLNDAERNDQVRMIAFKHLQNSGHYVRLRSKFDGKQKSYMTDKFDFNMTPADLIKRLEADTIQNAKTFGMFISHSFKDADIVKHIIAILNNKGISCYCDWMSDNDFLKRSLVSDYTKEVLKKRIEQSNAVLFIRTNNSMTGTIPNSPWIAMELEHSEKIGKKLFCVDLSNDGIELSYTILEHNLSNNEISLLM